MHISQRNLKLEGSGVSKLMQFPPLGGGSPDTDMENVAAAAFLEMTARNGSALLVGHEGNASFVDAAAAVEMTSKATGLSNAMAKLRSRRGKTSEAKPNTQSHSVGLNFMTQDDQEYAVDETYAEDNYFSDPVVGQLCEAEHRGRLVSFM